MRLSGETLLPCGPERAWALLHDPECLQRALPGCEELLALEEPGAYRAALLLAVGPLRARFAGRLELFELRPPQSYRLRVNAQGGAAGHGRGEAEVRLQPSGAQTRLLYQAELQLGGRLAQLGTRLIEPAGQQLASAFFAALVAELERAPAAAAAADVPAVAREPWWRRLWRWLTGARR